MPDTLSEQLLQELREQRETVTSAFKEHTQALRDVSDRLSRVETVLIPAPGQPSVLQDHEARIQKMEQSESRAKGALWAFSAFWTVIWTAWEYLIHHR